MSCKDKKASGPNAPAPLEVSWKLVSNFVPEGCEAKFILHNTSGSELSDTGWALYFNISPRVIVATPEPQPARVEHINGDWYRLVPNPGFRLGSGDTIEVTYRSRDFVIKETDAPLGLYLVRKDKDGREGTPIPLGNARVLPFEQHEQQLRGAADADSIQRPSVDYYANQGLKMIDRKERLPFIPQPVKYQWGNDTFQLTPSAVIAFDKGLNREADFLAEKLQAVTGKKYRTRTDLPEGSNGIRLTIGQVKANEVQSEAYEMQVNKNGIQIKGSDAAGVFYGVQSLLGMIPPEAYRQKPAALGIPGIMVYDAPRFAFRSMHLDVGRNFQSKESVKKLLDIMAAYKLNHFLFYLTEDEGWRLEIKDLPELTETGARRSHQPGKEAAGLHPAYGSGPIAESENNRGTGYYTAADFVEILKYAQARHIKIIPEVNFPGHARAAIKSMQARYERLMKQGKQQEAEAYLLADPKDQSVYVSAQGYRDNVVDVTRESAYRFYAKVMDEMAALYRQAGLSLDVIHMGGDEVPDGAWTGLAPAKVIFDQSPELSTYKNFHGYFISRLLPVLQQRNLRVHGWEEAALLYKKGGGYEVNPAFAGKLVPYIWNNLYDPDLGYRMANAGYQVVLCNVTNFYFDLAYNNHPQEPGLYWAGFVDAKDAFLFDPYNMFATTFTDALGKKMKFGKVEALKPEARKNIIGVQAQLWSETVKGPGMMEYYTLPKLFGFAQSAWSGLRSWENVTDPAEQAKRMQEDWNVFANTLAASDLPRLHYLNGGYNYRVPPPGAIVEQGMLKANVAFPGLEIRYTTDGSDPVVYSALLTAPVSFTGKEKLRCFDAAGNGSRVIKP